MEGGGSILLEKPRVCGASTAETPEGFCQREFIEAGDKKVFSFFSKKGNLNDLPEAWNELVAATAVHGVVTLSLAVAPFHPLLHPTSKHHLTVLHFLTTLLP